MEKKKYEECMTGLSDTCDPAVSMEVSERQPEKTADAVKNRRRR